MGYDTDYLCCIRFNKPFTKSVINAFKRLASFSKHGSSMLPRGEMWFELDEQLSLLKHPPYLKNQNNRDRIEWLKYLMGSFFKGKGYVGNGRFAIDGEERKDRFECVVIDNAVQVGPARYKPFVSSKERKRLEAEAKKQQQAKSSVEGALSASASPSAPTMSAAINVSPSSSATVAATDSEGDAQMTEQARSDDHTTANEEAEEEDEDEEYEHYSLSSGNNLSWSETEAFLKQTEAEARKQLGLEDAKEQDEDEYGKHRKGTTLQEAVLMHLVNKLIIEAERRADAELGLLQPPPTVASSASSSNTTGSATAAASVSSADEKAQQIVAQGQASESESAVSVQEPALKRQRVEQRVAPSKSDSNNSGSGGGGGGDFAQTPSDKKDGKDAKESSNDSSANQPMETDAQSNAEEDEENKPVDVSKLGAHLLPILVKQEILNEHLCLGRYDYKRTDEQRQLTQAKFEELLAEVGIACADVEELGVPNSWSKPTVETIERLAPHLSSLKSLALTTESQSNVERAVDVSSKAFPKLQTLTLDTGQSNIIAGGASTYFGARIDVIGKLGDRLTNLTLFGLDAFDATALLRLLEQCPRLSHLHIRQSHTSAKRSGMSAGLGDAGRASSLQGMLLQSLFSSSLGGGGAGASLGLGGLFGDSLFGFGFGAPASNVPRKWFAKAAEAKCAATMTTLKVPCPCVAVPNSELVAVLKNTSLFPSLTDLDVVAESYEGLKEMELFKALDEVEAIRPLLSVELSAAPSGFW